MAKHVTQACLSDQKVAHTPIKIKVKYKSDDEDLIAELTLYRRIICCLIYLTITRPDFSYSIEVLSQFFTKSSRHHFLPFLKLFDTSNIIRASSINLISRNI